MVHSVVRSLKSLEWGCMFPRLCAEQIFLFVRLQQTDVWGIRCEAITNYDDFQIRMLSFEVLYESFAGITFTIVFCTTVSILDNFRAAGDKSGLVGGGILLLIQASQI